MKKIEIWVFNNRVKFAVNDLIQPNDIISIGSFTKHNILQYGLLQSNGGVNIRLLKGNGIELSYEFIEAVYDCTESTIITHNPTTNKLLYELFDSLMAKML